MTSNYTYQSVFDYLFDSIAMKQENEKEFIKSFFATFGDLNKEQAELKNSSRGEDKGQVILKMRFKEFSIRFVFNSSKLLEAEMKVSKEVFTDLKAYAKNKYSGTRSLTWEKEMFGMMETLKAHHFNTEANFTKVIGMGHEVTIKGLSEKYPPRKKAVMLPLASACRSISPASSGRFNEAGEVLRLRSA